MGLSAAILACVLALCPVDRVIDGDTIVVAGERVRLRAASGPVDAPEMRGSCAAEVELAWRARGRVEALVTAGVTLEPVERDRYGRLVSVVRNARGWDVGEELLAARLAKRFGPGWSKGNYVRPEWCE